MSSTLFLCDLLCFSSNLFIFHLLVDAFFFRLTSYVLLLSLFFSSAIYYLDTKNWWHQRRLTTIEQSHWTQSHHPTVPMMRHDWLLTYNVMPGFLLHSSILLANMICAVSQSCMHVMLDRLFPMEAWPQPHVLCMQATTFTSLRPKASKIPYQSRPLLSSFSSLIFWRVSRASNSELVGSIN